MCFNSPLRPSKRDLYTIKPRREFFWTLYLWLIYAVYLRAVRWEACRYTSVITEDVFSSLCFITLFQLNQWLGFTLYTLQYWHGYLLDHHLFSYFDIDFISGSSSSVCHFTRITILYLSFFCIFFFFAFWHRLYYWIIGFVTDFSLGLYLVC